MILLQYIRLNILDNLEKCLKGKRNRNGTMDSFFLLSAKKQICQESELSKHFNERSSFEFTLSNKSSSKYFIFNGDIPDIFFST